MENEFLVFESEREKIEDSPLWEYLNDWKIKNEPSPIYHVWEDQIRSTVKELGQRWVYKSLAKRLKTVEAREKFKTTVNWVLIQGDVKPVWNVNNTDRPTHYQDTMLWTGEMLDMTQRRRRKDLWNSKRYELEYDNPLVFMGTVSAYIMDLLKFDMRERGYAWQHTHNGQTYHNVLTGDTHCDFRLFRYDRTEHPTKDPFWNEVQYRPLSWENDTRLVAGYHSVEPQFLVGVMKWIEQIGKTKEVFGEDGSDIFTWLQKIGRWWWGTCSEHFGGSDFADNPEFLLMNFYDCPLPGLDEDNRPDGRSIDGMPLNGESSMMMYIGPNQELVFSHSKNREKIEVVASFYPDEAVHLVKWVLQQSSLLLGRTSVDVLVNMIHYRMQSDFEKRIKENL